MKKIIYILLAAMLIVGSYYLYMYWALGNDSVQHQSFSNQDDRGLESAYPVGLEAEVYETVDSKTEGVWDKKLTLNKIENSQKAAEGTWYANDVWGWIAWQESGEEWKVLVSLDGFDCDELATAPSEHTDFFHDSTHAPDGKSYCYSHAARSAP